MTAAVTATSLRRLRSLALGAVLIVGGSACAGGSAAISGSPGGGQAPVEIPQPGTAASYTPPVLPERGLTMPPDTIPLETLYRQGAADVLRGLLVPPAGAK